MATNLYVRWPSTSGSAGTGDVVGPASATNNAAVRFDGTTGKIIQDSGVIIDDSNNVSGVVNFSATGTTTLNTGLTGVVKAASGVISAGSLVNADVSATAAIALSKLAATTISRALVSDGSGFVSPATTTAAEIGFVNGVTSAIQTQINARIPSGTGAIVNADVNASAAIAYSKLNLATSIVNADIAAGAAIVDTKLATISTASKVSNSATTATALNTNSAIVARDGSGNFAAGTITAALTGNATNVTGVVALLNGGTGTAAASANAAFNALSPMTTGGDIIYGGASGVGTRLANGLVRQALLSGGGTAAPIWGFSAVTAKTTTYPITSSDEIITCSGSAFTVTLPTAVGVTGQQYVIKKTDSTLANIITVATTSSQTIDGVTTTTLNTQYESITVVSDGTNWQLIDRVIPSNWVTYTPTFTGYGSPSSVSFVWRRRGDSIQVAGLFTCGTTTAVPGRIELPTGLNTANTSKIPVLLVAGCGFINSNTQSTFVPIAIPSVSYIATAFASAATAGLSNGTSVSAYLGSGNTVSFLAELAISGWNG